MNFNQFRQSPRKSTRGNHDYLTFVNTLGDSEQLIRTPFAAACVKYGRTSVGSIADNQQGGWFLLIRIKFLTSKPALDHQPLNNDELMILVHADHHRDPLGAVKER